ncbi:hypothetical protein WJX77_001417 [Trebouxia sp. C0004]
MDRCRPCLLSAAAAAILNTKTNFLTAAEAETLSVDAHTAKLHELSNTVLAKQPGGSLVAYPCGAGHCQVICHKSVVGNIYKGLKAQQSHLEIKMPDVKTSVSLSALSNPELEAAFSTAVQVRLTSQGWSKLDHSHLVHYLWSSQAGNQEACSSVKISVTCCNPATVMIQAETGVVMLKLLDLKSMLPPNLRSIIEEPQDGLKSVESLQAVNRAVEGLPCSLMPDGRPAIVSHFSETKTEEANVRQQWLVNTGAQLPDAIQYIVHVRFVDDCDAPTVPYPSCCVLRPGGLCHTPHKPGSHGQAMVLRKLTDALSEPNTFWKGTAQLLLHQHTFHSQAVVPASKPEPPAGTGWATAAHRQSQHAGSRKGGGDPPDASLFALSEYQLADHVLATAPTGADHDDCRMLVKRLLRPKVEVSEHLKLLLQNSEMRQPTHAAFTPCKQIAASTASYSAGPVVLKKLPQYRHTVGSAPVTLAESTDQPTSMPPSSGQLQSGSAAATQGVKRPATQADAPLVPALLKRPKLANHSKQLVSKAAASKTNAAGKAAAARKAPAGPKAAAKTASAKAGAKAASVPENGASATPGVQMPMTAAPDAVVMSAPSAASTAVPLGTDNIATVALAPGADAVAAMAAATAPARAPRQRKKADDIDLAEVEKKIQEKFAAGKLADLSIPELKCFLKARKLPVGGKKSDLVTRVEPLLTKS